MAHDERAVFMSTERRLRFVESPPAEERMPDMVMVSSIQPQRIDHLWYGRLAAGKITVLDGDPGLGKSTLTLEIAAAFSAGKLLPGQDAPLEPSSVIILSAEDGEGDTIRPRLEVAGADLNKVFIFRMKSDEGHTLIASIPEDLRFLEMMIQATRAGLVIIDPFMAFLSPEMNANRDQDVRRALAPLATILEENGTACMILRHLNKSIGSSPLYRGGGSIGIIGAARFGLIVAKDPEDESGRNRILAPQKVNLAAEPPALRYCLEGVPGTDVARIQWMGEANITTTKLLGDMQDDQDRGAMTEAREWLHEMLRNGPRSSSEIKKDAAKDQIATRTLERAKSALGVKAHRDGYGPNGKWVWSLPGEHGLLLPTSPIRTASPDPIATETDNE